MIIKPVGRNWGGGWRANTEHWAVHIKEVFARVGGLVSKCMIAYIPHIAINIIKCFPLRFQ